MTTTKRMRMPVVRLKDRGRCYLGEIDIPLDGGGRVAVSALGWSPMKTLRKVSTFARRVATDPAVQMFVPPQAKVAIAAARKVASLAQRRPDVLRAVMPSLPPAVQRLAMSVLTSPDKSPATSTSTAASSTAPVDPDARKMSVEKLYEGAQYTPEQAPPPELPDPGYPDPGYPGYPGYYGGGGGYGGGYIPEMPGVARDEYGQDVDPDDYFQDEEAAHVHHDGGEAPLDEVREDGDEDDSD